MARLASLLLTDSGLSGLLPATMTRLRGLSVLMLGGTGLCAPDDDDFRAWLNGVPKRRIPSCEDLGEGSAAYLARRRSRGNTPYRWSPAKRRFSGCSWSLRRPRATRFSCSNHLLPGWGGGGGRGNRARLVSHRQGSERRITECVSQRRGSGVRDSARSGNGGGDRSRWDHGRGAGRQAAHPRDGPQGREGASDAGPGIHLDPLPVERDPDSAILDVTEDLSADDELLWAINTLLPVADIDLEIHDPVVSTSNGAFSLLHQTSAIRAAENGTGFFMGTMSGPVTGALGVAYAPGWASFSLPDSSVMAHELGHNMSLSHAPCGGAGGPDPSFPQSDGSIGAWGYDFDSGELVDPSIRDLMSYCDPTWISEFYFTNSLRYRLAVETEERRARQAAPAPSLLIWAGSAQTEFPTWSRRS